MGKTSLATTIAYSAGKALLAEARQSDPNAIPKKCVAILSLEMSAEQLATRLLSEETDRIRSDRIRLGDISQRDFDKSRRASCEDGKRAARDRRHAGNHVVRHANPRTSVEAHQRAGADRRRLSPTHASGGGTQPENRVLEIAQITQGLKAIAKELEVPVLRCHSSRVPWRAREDKRPQLADLRELGHHRQDADVVMFLDRDEYVYPEQGTPQEARFERSDRAIDRERRLDRRTWSQRAQPGRSDHRQERHGPTGPSSCSSRRSSRVLPTWTSCTATMQVEPRVSA